MPDQHAQHPLVGLEQHEIDARHYESIRGLIKPIIGPVEPLNRYLGELHLCASHLKRRRERISHPTLRGQTKIYCGQ